MLVAFPAPVLSVTADTVRELEGSEALSGLWTLFTNCKESLKDGRRLENISWRLWYRELMLAGPPSEKKHPVERDGDGDHRPLTLTLDMDERASLPLIPMHTSIPLTCKPSSVRRSSSVNQGTSMRVGKIIYDMLPPPRSPSTTTTGSSIAAFWISPSNTTSRALPTANMGATPATNPTESEPRSVRYNLSILPLLPLPEPTTTREAVISAAESLPTPALEDVKGGYVSSGTVAESSTTVPLSATTHVSPSYAAGPPSLSLLDVYAHAHPGEVSSMQLQIASVQTSSLSSSILLWVSQPPLSTTSPSSSANPLPLPSTSPSTSTVSTQISIQTPTPCAPPPPTLVVVNPTPNPTPHPTLPATPAPVLLGAGGGVGERRASGQYLMLPGRAGTPLRAAAAVGGEVRVCEAHVRNDDCAQDTVEMHDKEPDSKPHQHHQKYNSTSSRASSSVSVAMGTTGVTSASASDIDGSKVVDQEEASQGDVGFTSRDDRASPSVSPLPAEASYPPSKSSPKSSSINANAHSHSPKPSQPQSHSRSPTATARTTTAHARALQPAPATAITHCASSSGGGGQSQSRPSLSISGTSTSAKGKSRSRSRDAGPGVLALGMGMTKKVAGGGVRGRLGCVSRGKIGGAAGGRGLSRKGVGEGEQGEEEREALNVRAERECLARMKAMEVLPHRQQQREGESQREWEGERKREREKRSALFNIGSNSDNGSKSAGSGSDVSGLVGGAYELTQAAAWKGNEREGDKVHQKEIDEFRAKMKEREEAVAANLALAAQQLARMGGPLLPAQLAAPLLPQQLAAPLLPQQQRRTIVLATSKSDYETDSDEDEDGSWSSEEMSGDENGDQVEVKPVAPPPPPAPTAPPIVHRITPIQKTVSNQTNTRTKPISRAQIHRAQAQANTQAIMEKAAAEAQRQRDMFAKLPVASFQDLERGGGPSRTRSTGLLTQLLNPPLEIFLVNHPYRRGYNSGEICVGQGQQQRGQGHQQKGQGQAGPSLNAPSGPSHVLSRIQASKSAAALPISSQVQVGSAYRRGVALAAMPTVGPVLNRNGNTNVNGGGGYRPKGRPQGQELEDDSGSDDEANTGIQVSKSVAQERLKALAQRRGIVTHGKQRSMGGRLTTLDDNVVPPWLNGGPQPGPSTAYSQLHRQVSDRRLYPEEQPPTPTPIPVGHPYNLPPPTAPSTPRTARRQMLQAEMSESLRRNSLWERQVSKVNLVGYRASTNGGGRGNVLGGLKPLTTTPSMVQLRAKGEAAATGNGNGAAGPSGADQTQQRRGSGGEAEEREERRRLAMVRNKSWADDYHFKGW